MTTKIILTALMLLVFGKVAESIVDAYKLHQKLKK
jgi:hypothetical protein